MRPHVLASSPVSIATLPIVILDSRKGSQLLSCLQEQCWTCWGVYACQLDVGFSFLEFTDLHVVDNATFSFYFRAYHLLTGLGFQDRKLGCIELIWQYWWHSTSWGVPYSCSSLNLTARYHFLVRSRLSLDSTLVNGLFRSNLTGIKSHCF